MSASWSCERTSQSNEHSSGTTFFAVPPRISPTLAVVMSSSRPSRRSAIARAAAAMAERPSSGAMPGVRRLAAEDRLDRRLVRRAEDDVADRRRPGRTRSRPATTSRVSSNAPAPSRPVSSFGVKSELDAGVRPALGQDPPHRLEHHRDRRLVVGAEDRPPRVADHALVVDDRLDRAVGRHGVEVRAEEDRRAAVLRGRLDARVEVPHRRADPCAGVVLVDVEPEVAQVARDARRRRPAPARTGSASRRARRRARATSVRPFQARGIEDRTRAQPLYRAGTRAAQAARPGRTLVGERPFAAVASADAVLSSDRHGRRLRHRRRRSLERARPRDLDLWIVPEPIDGVPRRRGAHGVT